jgi:hypothetical protein
MLALDQTDLAITETLNRCHLLDVLGAAEGGFRGPQLSRDTVLGPSRQAHGSRCVLPGSVLWVSVPTTSLIRRLASGACTLQRSSELRPLARTSRQLLC